MAKQTINIGTSANDGTGSTLREAFDITNDNFTELYDGTGGLLYKLEGTNFTGSLLIGHSNTGTLSSAQFNTGVGIGALDALTTGDMNVALGYAAGSNINTGTENVALGSGAFQTATDSSRNIAIGRRALSVQDVSGNAYNIAIGHDAGRNVTTGTNNTIIGGLAGDALTTSVHSVAIGYKALTTEDTGHFSVAIGSGALEDQNYDGSAFNVAVGYEAGNSISTGIQNTIVGGAAADSLTTGSNNIVLGYNAEASAVDVSNEVTIGNSSITNVRIPSDSTLKIGASGDLQLEHLSSNSFIKNTAVGDLYIENQVDDKDIIFRSDDGSGGLATYFACQGSGVETLFYKRARWADNVQAQFGASADMALYHDGSHSYLKQSGTGDLYIQQFRDDGDIVFQSDDGSGAMATYFFLDGSSSKTVFPDNKQIQIGGGGGDGYIYSDGTNMWIQGNNPSADMKLYQGGTDGSIRFYSDNGSGGVAEYFAVDGGEEQVRFFKETEHQDSVKAKFGDSGDLQIQHTGSTGIIDNQTGDLIVKVSQDDGDIIVQSDNGSGGIGTYFRVDGGQLRTEFELATQHLDNIKANFGSSSDLAIYHNGSDSFIQSSGTGDLIIEQRNDDKDIVFNCDDGSGGVTEYFRLDGSNAGFTTFPDNTTLAVGTDRDFRMSHDGTDTNVWGVTGDIIFTNYADDKDIVFRSDNGSGDVTPYITLDGSNVRTRIDREMRFMDTIPAKFGTGGDLTLRHNATDSYIENNTGDLLITNNADDKDIVFRSDNGSGGTTTYFKCKGDETITQFIQNTNHQDNTKATFGTSFDLQIYHNNSNDRGYIYNTTGDLYIENDATDGDIKFYSDDGSGGTAQYFRLDGGVVETRFLKSTLHFDNVSAKFGDSGDCQIVHDGSNTKIVNITGDLKIGVANTLAIQNNAYDENIASFTKNGAVNLYHDNSKKLETTSTGATVTGTLIAATGDLETSGVGYGLILKSPNGTRYRVTVDNSGNLSTTAL